MEDWTEKYRPSSLSEIRGNDAACDELLNWAKTWSDHRNAAIVHGSPGVGKTSAAHALADDLDWDVIELNASDERQASAIDRVAGEASKSGTLTGGGVGRRLVILDEADNFHGTVDYGGSRAVTEVVSDASQPIVLIANEFYDMSRSLRSSCETIEFRDVSARSIVPVLRDICRREDIEYDADALEAIADSTSGDLRSAINDLQAVADSGDRLTADDIVTADRDRSQGIFPFLDDLLKSASAAEAVRASRDVDETPDSLLAWVEDNLPKVYEGAELAEAYSSIAAADRWLGRVLQSQEYRYWRYASNNITAGVAAARAEPKSGWTRFNPPRYWSKLGQSRSRRDTRDAIATRVATLDGVSTETARREVLPYVSAMTHHCTNRETTVEVAAAYDLDTAEISFVTGSGESTNKVEEVHEDAQAQLEGEVSAAFDSSAPSAFETVTNEPTSESAAEQNGDSGESTDAEREEPEPEDDESEDQTGLSDFM